MIPSHVSFVANIANLLAGRGHKVVVIDNVLRSDIPNRLNVTAIDKVITVKTSEKVAELLADKSIPSKFWRMKNEPEEQKEVMQSLGELFLEQCNHLMTNEKMFDELRNLDFDFGIHEVFDVCGIGIFEKLGLRNSVILSSTGVRDIVNEALGISGPLQDSSILSDYGGSVPILGTRRNLKFHSAWRNFFEIQSKHLEKAFNFNSSFEDLLRYSNLMFLNTHELTDTQRPWSRRVHEIGGISFKTPKLLNDEYIGLFSNYSTVVLVSFGTTTPSLLMPEDYKNTLISVFLKIPKVLFIWKYEQKDQFTNEFNGKNVIFKNYVPQVDLLESKRISLFITHGGQNSILEAFHSNTRTLIIPLFGDQHRNAQISLENGLSHVLKKEDLTNDEMVERTIKQGLRRNKRIEDNLKRVSMNLQNAKQILGIKRRTKGNKYIQVSRMLWAFILLNSFCLYGSAFDILVYAPRMMQSHVYFTARIANVLAARGHKVTVIDNIFRYDVDNELSPDIHRILTVEPSPEVTKLLNTGSLPTILWNSKASPEEQKAIMEGLGHVHRLQCAHLIENSTLIPKLQEMKFDFAIHEVFDSCGVGILEVIGVQKTVIVSSTGPMDVVPIALGVSDTLNTPSLLSDYGSFLSFYEKRRNLKFLSGMLNFHEMQDAMISPLFKKKYGLKKSSGDIMRQANLLFYNIHEGSDGMRMRGRRSYDIGGIAFKEQKNLTTEYQNLLSDPRPKVLVSFGTAATSSHMPQNLKTSLLNAMKQMNDVLFIWKYESDDDFTKAEEMTSNVVFKKFMPQTDLLASGKIALFITHCGQNSLLEAFHAGVRVLAVPLFGDQHRNAKLAKENGLIEVLPKKDIETSSKIVEAVRNGLLRNEKIERNLIQVSSLLQNAKKNAENLLISTIESTYSVDSPPDFSKFPKNYHPNILIVLIDSALAMLFGLIAFVIFKLLRKNIR
ncbi:unnamed protein product [Caenorhabditis brenneri]